MNRKCMKLRAFISKGLGFAYVFLRYMLKRKKNDIDNKQILFIFGGHLGNAVLNIDTLLEVGKRFPKSQGWTISVLCNKSIKNILCTIADVSQFDFLDIEFPYEDGGTVFGTVYKTLNFFNGKRYEKIIVNLAHIMPLATYIVAAVPSNDSIGVFDDLSHESNENHDIEHNFGNARWYFEKAYKTQIRVEFNTQEVIRQKLILNHLGIDYKTRVYPIKKLCDYSVPSEKYFTVAIDSANMVKRWEPQKFAEVINLVVENYGLLACVTGGGNASDIFKMMQPYLKHPEKTLNYIGKTSFKEWVELLRGSSFHFGVDSGSIHVASSVGTQAFSMIGVWDGTRVLPYMIEDKSKCTKEPICIYMDGVMNLTCYGCIPKRGLMGSGNSKCMELCRQGKICYCLENISVDDSYRTIEQWMNVNL